MEQNIRAISAYLIIGNMIAIAFIPNFANAATVSPEVLNAVPDLFQARFQGMQGALLGYARNLFMILAGIEFSYAMISIAFKRGDLGDVAAALVQQILFIGIAKFNTS